MTQTIWNFLPKAEASLIELALNLAEKGMPETAEFIMGALGDAKSVMKFAMPMNGKIINDKLRGLPDGFRLPFPSVCIEYPTDNSEEGTNIIPDAINVPSKRIVIATEYALTDNVRENSVAGLLLKHAKKRAPANATHMTIVAALCEQLMSDGTLMWAPNWSIGTVYNTRSTNDHFSGSAVAIPCELGAAITEQLRSEGKNVIDYAHQDIGHEVHAVLELIEALSCSNVRPECIPAPPKLNAKRAKNGKPPLPDYHVLTISSHHHQDEKATRAALGDRRAPRAHLRRGHIRVYQSGLRIWINSMMVGNAANGIINKDYRMKA